MAKNVKMVQQAPFFHTAVIGQTSVTMAPSPFQSLLKPMLIFEGPILN